LLGATALVAVWILAWRRRERLVTPALAYATCVALLLASAKVASPQFLLWLVPLVALVGGRAGIAAAVVLGAACVLTQLIYPSRYDALVAGDAFPLVLLAARNILLLALVVILAFALTRRLQGKGVAQEERGQQDGADVGHRVLLGRGE
jgi:hypothetical protein